MYRYDPLVAPDPQEWLAMDENERVVSVERYHRRQRIRMPNVRVHALFQTIAENQIAMGDEIPAAAKLRELMAEGLDRHEALHAITSVVGREYYLLMKGELKEDAKVWFEREMKALTKARWEEEYGVEGDHL